jgi:release factor H-coupled RctB family protein
VKTVAILPENPEHYKPFIQNVCKNKLRIKRPTRFFVLKKNFVIELKDDFHAIAHTDSLIISSGENLVSNLEVKSLKEFQEEENTKRPRVEYIGSLIDPGAVKQLETIAELPGMKVVVGMPDLHMGLKTPIGACFATTEVIYPALIGGDIGLYNTNIGCGMSLYKLNVQAEKMLAKKKIIASKIGNLDDPWQVDIKQILLNYNIPSSAFDSSLGTIGRGNHFAEIQVVGQIFNQEKFSHHGFQRDRAYLLVHSGSRGLGKQVFDEFGDCRLEKNTPEFADYLRKHDSACLWAKANRDSIARRVFDCLNLSYQRQEKLVDIWHNSVELKCFGNREQLYLHRKGAAPSDNGLIVIPGSRGALTYLVEAIGDQESNCYSVAHGAGREMSRTKAASTAKSKFQSKKLMIESLSRNSYGGIVICDDLELLCEEAPMAYKDIDVVVNDLIDAGIIRLIATLKPMITYKMKT